MCEDEPEGGADAPAEVVGQTYRVSRTSSEGRYGDQALVHLAGPGRRDVDLAATTTTTTTTTTSTTTANTTTTTTSSTATTSTSSTGTGSLSWAGWNILSNPISATQQTALPFGDRSHWLQPWRAYLDTQPAAMLRNAVGINFNVAPQDASATARLLAQSGFTRARLEIGWNSMSFADPSQLQSPASIDTRLAALKAVGIRPLILLNANDGGPGPSLSFAAHITQSVAAGARTVQVDSATARMLVPGLSGFDIPGGPVAAFIATSVSSTGLVQLSQPIPVAIQAGTYTVTTLRYPPFAPPFTANGNPNPAFELTLSGWLQYVKAVTSEARKVLGSDNFDVEVWNEMSFGSSFLDVTRYYNPVPSAMQGIGSVPTQLLARTVKWIRDPANGLPDVGIGDGFANESPFVSGTTVPQGVTAIDKHPYHEEPYAFPGAQPFPANQRPVNALGTPEGSVDQNGNWHDSFAPTYTAFFPEYLLSGIQTEFLERDLSPTTTYIGSTAHGRTTKPAGATTAPQDWITETNIDLASSPKALTTADKWHLQAKATLRTLSAYVNKGVSALYLYAVGDGDYAMVDTSQPGGGPTMTAVKTFTQAFAGPATIPTRRSISLSQIADQGNWTQFAGDGTAAHPPLYNRQVVAFLPFQVDTNKFVVPAYVMTRNMATLYNPSAPSTDVTRYDMPPETYRLTVGGVNATNLKVTATDPLTGSSVPVQVTPTSSTTAVLEVGLTDYPRLLVLQDG